MSGGSFEMVPEMTIRIEGGLKPSGRLRRTSASRFSGNNFVRIRGQLVRKVDEVFRPELQEDGGFVVAQYDPDIRFAAIVDDLADFYVAVGRYLDSVHGTVVGEFVAPATAQDVADMAARGGRALP